MLILLAYLRAEFYAACVDRCDYLWATGQKQPLEGGAQGSAFSLLLAMIPL